MKTDVRTSFWRTSGGEIDDCARVGEREPMRSATQRPAACRPALLSFPWSQGRSARSQDYMGPVGNRASELATHNMGRLQSAKHVACRSRSRNQHGLSVPRGELARLRALAVLAPERVPLPAREFEGPAAVAAEGLDYAEFRLL